MKDMLYYEFFQALMRKEDQVKKKFGNIDYFLVKDGILL
jgi:hypothetical protein